MKQKNNSKPYLSKKEKVIISLVFSLHLLGIIVAFFRTDIPFHYHLLRFFCWWSVHTSILTVLAAVMMFRESRYNSLPLGERKKNSSYFTQFITLLATMYNLITFLFWVYCLFFLKGSIEWEKSLLFNFQLVSWHIIAPLLTILYFYFYARVDKLREKLLKTLLFAPISPVFYFFFTWTLAKLNYGVTSSLFPHLEKYPCRIFELITEVRWNWFIINFLTAAFVFILLCSLIIWTKIICDKKIKNYSE